MTTLTRRRAGLVSAAAVAAGFLVVAAAGPAFTATSDAPSTMIRKSVQTLMDPDGTVQATRIYTQIQSTGNGQVQFTDTTSGSLRNLNGFGTPPVSDNTATFDFSVDGLKNQRTLQDFVKSDLPIKVKVEATLDGQPISPNDIVGKSGLLKMTYTITNDTSVDQEITWKDGTGATQTKTVGIPIPYVGSFSTTLSDSYADIVAPGAAMGGTGRNSTQLNYNLLLYKPLGDTTATVTYEAKITNADIPSVDMTFLPAGPAENPSTKALQDQIKGGAESGAQITDAGSQIDENLLKLADGAGKLNAGLATLYAGSQSLADGLNNTAIPGAKKLAAGADQLSAGLNDTAVPGANKLAAGSSDLAAGLNDVAVPGAKKIAAGNAQLAAGLSGAVTGSAALSAGLDAASSGADDLAVGAAQLNGGLALLNAGLTDLYNAGANLPASVNAQLATDVNYQTLLGTLQAIITGIGGPNDSSQTTVLGGLNNVKWGLRNPNWGGAGCDPAASALTPTWCGVGDVNQLISAQLTAAATAPSSTPGSLNSLADGISNTTTGAAAFCNYIADPTIKATCIGTHAVLATCVNGGTTCTTTAGTFPSVRAQSLQAAGGLTLAVNAIDGQLVPGINQLKKVLYNTPCDPAQTNPSAADYCGISQALALVKGGIPQLVTAITTGISAQLTGALGTGVAPCDPTLTLRCAGNALAAGAGQLDTGLTQLSGGLTQLSAGAAQLAAGLAPAGPGANDLAAGSQQLATGLVTAADGANQVAAGNATLAAGLSSAADGSTQVADGANQIATGLAPAAAGATQIADGVGTTTVGCDPTATLACGSSAIEDGANQLSAQGSKLLIAKGNETTNSYGEQYATMEALNARSATQAGIPNGPAKGQDVVTTGAFGYTLQAVSQADSTNALRFLLAGLLLAGAVGLGVAFGRN